MALIPWLLPLAFHLQPGWQFRAAPAHGSLVSMNAAWLKAASMLTAARGLLMQNRHQENAEDCVVGQKEYCQPGGNVIFLRHGESAWNSMNRFTGWHDVALTTRGELEAAAAARILDREMYCIDKVYTSTLKRTIKTAWIVLEELDDFTVPIVQSWRLNERMYGALTGLNKGDTRAMLGEDNFELLRREPPALQPGSCYDPVRSRSFYNVPRDQIPTKESFSDTLERVLPYWKEEILPTAKAGKTVLVISSKNLLRVILSILKPEASSEHFYDLDIPNGIPFVYTPEDGSLRALGNDSQANVGQTLLLK